MDSPHRDRIARNVVRAITAWVEDMPAGRRPHYFATVRRFTIKVVRFATHIYGDLEILNDYAAARAVVPLAVVPEPASERWRPLDDACLEIVAIVNRWADQTIAHGNAFPPEVP